MRWGRGWGWGLRRACVVVVVLLCGLVAPSIAAVLTTVPWNSWVSSEVAQDERQRQEHAATGGARRADGVDELGTLPTVPRAACRPEDRPETGLQGQVPLADRLSGRAAAGYSCNLDLLARSGSFAWATLDSYRDCAYYGESAALGRTVVLDVSHPGDIRTTASLRSEAMKNPWESLRVHAGRGLLVADRNTTGWLDVYDVKSNCRKPRLLSSMQIAEASGHEGFFSADGRTYYMTNGATPGLITPVDLSNPSKPRPLATWTHVQAPHGGWTSPDGKRTYVCQQGNFTGDEAEPDALVILDSTKLQQRAPNPEAPILALLPLGDNTWCQSVYPVTYGGRQYVIQYGERTPVRQTKCADATKPQYAYPRIVDITNEAAPKIVSSIFLEVDDPAFCALTSADANVITQGMDDSDAQTRQVVSALFHYDVHHCSPDRLVDPVLLACSYFNGGLRVFDIRDPVEPRELAAYNTGTVSQTDPTIDMAASRPVLRVDRNEVWWTTMLGGFHVARFAPGIVPREALQCPATPDAYHAHYDPWRRCRSSSSPPHEGATAPQLSAAAEQEAGEGGGTRPPVRAGRLPVTGPPAAQAAAVLTLLLLAAAARRFTSRAR